MTEERKGPLADMRVIELAHVMAAPTCSLMLADMGADVVKVERLPDGDDIRRFAPPWVDGEGAAYMMVNRNKRGIAVDLNLPEGAEVVRRLVAQADVFIENFRKGSLERRGLGADALMKKNPGLIYCSVSGFGRTGPYAERGGFDLIAQAMSGLMSVTGEGKGRPPVKVGSPAADIMAGVLSAMAISAAYADKVRSGKGRFIDTSLYEAAVILTYWQSAMMLATGENPVPLGSAHPLAAPYQAFECADGWIALGAANQKTWLQLLEVMEIDGLGEDSRFADNAARLANMGALADILTEKFKTRPAAEWLVGLEAAGVPAGPVATIGEMLEDPQTLARQMVYEVNHARVGKVKTLGQPVKISESGAAPTRGAPLLGQHSREVLEEYGFSEEEISALIESRAVGEGRSD